MEPSAATETPPRALRPQLYGRVGEEKLGHSKKPCASGLEQKMRVLGGGGRSSADSCGLQKGAVVLAPPGLRSAEVPAPPKRGLARKSEGFGLLGAVWGGKAAAGGRGRRNARKTLINDRIVAPCG